MVVFVCDMDFSAWGRLRITEVRVFCNCYYDDFTMGVYSI